MTIVLTRDIFVSGTVLASGTTQTLSNDIEADLCARGSATPANIAPGVSVYGANHILEHKAIGGVPRQVALSAIPFLIPPGDGSSVGLQFTGSAGAFTLSSAIMAGLGSMLNGCFMYMPDNFCGSGYPAGWYWAAFSTETAGTLYTNTYLSGIPNRPGTPTAFPSNLSGFLTTTTSEVTGPNGYVLYGGSIGKNGSLNMSIRVSGNNVNSHAFRVYLGSTSLWSMVGIYSSPIAEILLSARNQGIESIQCCSRTGSIVGMGVFSSSAEGGYKTVNTGIDNLLSISLQNAVNTACAVLMHANVTCTYGA